MSFRRISASELLGNC